jgi:hypothetical protein
MRIDWTLWSAARERAEPGGELAALLDRFQDMLASLSAKAASRATNDRHRRKVEDFLGHVDRASRRLGDQMYQPSYLLNVVGDAVVRADLPAVEAVEFMRVGLYFYGNKLIERRFARRAAVYHAIHAELLSAFGGRDAYKEMVEEARRKFAADKVFCLTYYYLNALKKAYWSRLRKVEDALEHAPAEVEFAPEPAAAVADEALDASDRVGLMLEIFARKLTAQQQRVYLAKNRSGASAASLAEAACVADDELMGLLRGLDDELEGHGNLGWSEIAVKLEINEKTAKREYLRALHTLLQESAKAVFGLKIESAYVRRVLAQLREIVYEKDLRIRSTAGEGLSRLVEKWEVALRFVLNHGRVSA